jgi:hypothetical protein
MSNSSKVGCVGIEKSFEFGSETENNNNALLEIENSFRGENQC